MWIAGGVIALFGAFVFAELSTVMPKVGGQYAFFREAFSPLVAFLYGWGLLLIVQTGATAAVGGGLRQVRGAAGGSAERLDALARGRPSS